MPYNIPKPPETYQGNQVIINSDRLLFNAKTDSILLFSSENIGFSTKGSIHFDTSSERENSRFVVNSPNIHLGLEFDNSPPHQSAVLSDELIESLNDILDMIKKVYVDLTIGISYTSTSPGTPTGWNPMNFDLMINRHDKIERIKNSLQNIKSEKVKLV
tara:strand:- start:5307 stop:5783 length:477 start_codon:yes stop_codon:yes gene_type:complete